MLHRPASATVWGCAAAALVWFGALSASAQPAARPMPPQRVEELPERLPPVEEGLTLKEVEQSALIHNPSLVLAVGNVRAAEGAWLQAGLYPNPTAGLGQAQTGSRGLAEQNYATLTQEFVTGGKLRLSRDVAAQGIAQSQQQLRAQELRVLTDVRTTFYDVATAQRQRALAGQLVAIAREGVRVAQEKNKGDDVGENDILEAQVEQYNAEIAARKAENHYQSAWRKLAAVVGDPALTQQEVQSDLAALPPERTWADAEHRLLAGSPEVAAAAASIERARAALARAGVEPIPNVTVQGLVNWRDNGAKGRTDGLIQVSIPLPIYNRNQGAVAQSQGELQAAISGLERLQQSLRNRLAPAYERYANARYQAQQYRERILAASERALMLTRRTYQAGKVEYDDLLTAQRTFAQANFNYLDALRELWTAESEIEGLLLSGSLAEAGDK